MIVLVTEDLWFLSLKCVGMLFLMYSSHVSFFCFSYLFLRARLLHLDIGLPLVFGSELVTLCSWVLRVK